MNKLSLIVLLIPIFTCGLIACDDDDDQSNVAARKKSGQQKITRIYEGFIANDSSSDAICPTGASAELTLDFVNSSLDFQVPESNVNLVGINEALIQETSELNAEGTDFSAIYSVADPGDLFDDSSCDALGGYSSVIEIKIQEGQESNSNVVFQAPYIVALRCSNPGVTSILCNGTFTGLIKN